MFCAQIAIKFALEISYFDYSGKYMGNITEATKIIFPNIAVTLLFLFINVKVMLYGGTRDALGRQ